jgi:hypothetical protein
MMDGVALRHVSVASLSHLESGIDFRIVRLQFLVDKWALEQVLVVSVSSPRSEFSFRVLHMGFVVDKTAYSRQIFTSLVLHMPDISGCC